MQKKLMISIPLLLMSLSCTRTIYHYDYIEVPVEAPFEADSFEYEKESAPTSKDKILDRLAFINEELKNINHEKNETDDFREGRLLKIEEHKLLKEKLALIALLSKEL